ncbi:Uncharacterized protein HZ326_26489 [Fusarium oxysporum f. sp. albedinis]|nr:Uncharacterized protein HZ326_26489 [Fusarium oxysporum f. sp. albedinis]
MHPRVLISNDREESTQVIYIRKPIFYSPLARKYVKECTRISSSSILYPVLEALVNAIGLAKIGISNFAVSKLANLALSAFFSVQPEFSGPTLTLFDFCAEREGDLFIVLQCLCGFSCYCMTCHIPLSGTALQRGHDRGRPLKRGRPRKYATAKDKATADTQRRRNKRQKAAARDRGLPYSKFHNLHYPIQQLSPVKIFPWHPLLAFC